MEMAVSAFQRRGSKHLPYRDVYVCHAVFKGCFPAPVFQRVQGNRQVCGIFPFSGNADRNAPVQHVNDVLLDVLVQFIIQGIYLYGFSKNFLECRADFRYGVGDNRKTALLPLNILVCHLRSHVGIINVQFLLFFIILAGIRVGLGRKALLPKSFHYRRPCIPASFFLPGFISGFQNLQPPFHKGLIQINGLVRLMVVFILAVGRRAAYGARACAPARKRKLPGTHHHRHKAQFLKIPYRCPHHPLEPNGVTQIHIFLFGQILPCHLKPNPVPFRIGVRHSLDFFHGKAV